MEKKLLETQFVLCIENSGCEDLEKRKFYQILPDEKAAQEGYLRIVDESPGGLFISRILFHFSRTASQSSGGTRSDRLRLLYSGLPITY